MAKIVQKTIKLYLCDWKKCKFISNVFKKKKKLFIKSASNFLNFKFDINNFEAKAWKNRENFNEIHQIQFYGLENVIGSKKQHYF